MKEILLIILTTIILSGCNNSSSKLLSEPDSNSFNKMDLGFFEVQLPPSFEFEPKKGVDSQVGEITNGTTTFNFDYGWYSNRGPFSFYDSFNKYFNNLYLDTFLDSIGINSNDSIRAMAQEKLEIISVQYEEGGFFQSQIRLDSNLHNFNSVSAHGDNTEYTKDYEIFIERTEKQYKKIYIPISNDKLRAGIYIEDLIAKRINRNAYNKLSFSTGNYNIENRTEILDILKTVTLKN